MRECKQNGSIATLSTLGNFFDNFTQWRRFLTLPAGERALTFYTEDVSSWAFFEPVIRSLLEDHHQPVAYLTSAPEDPRLTSPPEGLQAFWIGDGVVRTLAFMQLDVRLLVMTMPDLETMFLKRSRVAQVHYAHIFHSMVSSHMTYRPQAFDHFDSLLCAGPHHQAEIRAREALLGLPEKRLFPHGYGRLDHILGTRPTPLPLLEDPFQVLIAPSWGSHGLLETHGVEVTEILLQSNFRVVVRPHPHTRKTAPQCIEEIRSKFQEHPHFTLELDVASTQSLLQSTVMISDWSGAALDYAFGLERPVLFVDLPRKVNNPDYQKLGVEPLEVQLREQLGAVVQPEDLQTLPERIHQVLKDLERYPKHLAKLREQHIFHIGESGPRGAQIFMDLLAEQS
jgi:YidC/Oxa1 family membrane protein insertase